MLGNIIILGILIVIAIVGIRSSIKHFRGEGGCCGGDTVQEKKKKPRGEMIETRSIHIEGMHCQHCKQSVEGSLNEIEGVYAKVNLKKNTAEVSMTRVVDNEELKAAVEKAGFKMV